MKIEVKFEKLEQDTSWASKTSSDPTIPYTEFRIHTSRTKAINHFLTDFNKLIKGKTEFTLIGICEENKLDIGGKV